MEKLEYNHRFQLTPENRDSNSRIRELARRRADWEFSEKIAELVLDTSRQGTICFAPYQVGEYPETFYESTLRASMIYDYARQLPVIIHDGFKFQGIPIKAPEELTFLERCKFILTGKYPR